MVQVKKRILKVIIINKKNMKQELGLKSKNSIYKSQIRVHVLKQCVVL